METTPRTTMNQSSVSLLLRSFPPTEEEKRKPRLFLILFRGTYYKGASLFYKEHHMCRQKDHFLGRRDERRREKSFSSPFFRANGAPPNQSLAKSGEMAGGEKSGKESFFLPKATRLGRAAKRRRRGTNQVSGGGADDDTDFSFPTLLLLPSLGENGR